MTIKEYKKRGEGGSACPKCFVHFDEPTVPEPCNENFRPGVVCGSCRDGSWRRVTRRGRAQGPMEVRVDYHPTRLDVGHDFSIRAQDYQKRKRTALGLYDLASFKKGDTVATCADSPDANSFQLLADGASTCSAGGVCDDSDDVPESCKNQKRLGRLARKSVKLLELDRGLTAVRKLPEDIYCGGLRAAIRSVYKHDLSVVEELSVKTAQKLESNPCDFCEGRFTGYLDEWEKKVRRPSPADENHVRKFQRFLRLNVESGWNRKGEWVRVPNGHGTKYNTRREGGNWNEECFSDGCRTTLVHSAGKPRVVTLYSSYNQSVLHPLHRSLYASLGQFNWLLQGPPTDERVAALTGGDYHSFDYAAATDSLKKAYVVAMIDILIEKGMDLKEDEIRCLRVLEKTKIGEGWSEGGQPMGSLMSFPMLCLFNKTLVDMALADSIGLNLRHVSGETLKTFSSHPMLVNGDDLLTRDPPHQKKPFRELMVWHGAQIGLVVNLEKSMRDSSLAEINSTAFLNGKIQKKTNLGVLGIGRKDVGDALGLAADCTLTDGGFVYAAEALSGALAVQSDKKLRLHPGRIGFVKHNKRLKKSACAVPEPRENIFNPFPVTERPPGYDLFPEEERSALRAEVDRMRPIVISRCKEGVGKNRALISFGAPRTFRRVVRDRAKVGCDTIMVCLVRAWRASRDELIDNSHLSEMVPCSPAQEKGKERRVTVFSLISMIRELTSTRRPVGADTPA